MKKYLLPIIMLAAVLQGCNEQTSQQQYSQPQQYAASDVPTTNQPQVVYQQATVQEDHTIRDGLIGAGVGYMLGRHTAQNSSGFTNGGVHSTATPVVQRTVINKTVVVQQKNFYRPPTPNTTPRISAPRPSVSSTRSFSRRK